MPQPEDDSVPSSDAELVEHFAAFARTAQPRAPLYAALSNLVARDPVLYRLLDHAPQQQRLPVLLFASVHALLLDEPTHELAQWYPNLTADHRSPTERALAGVFTRFVDDHRASLEHLVATRTTQTNEVGRCAFLLPAIGLIAAEVGRIGHLDVGASGGLNLLLDRYQYRYRNEGGATTTVGADSRVVMTCDIRGDVPIPTTLPTIGRRCGVDLNPIDVTDPTEAHWLEACVWPDQADRFHRLVQAIELARQHPPELLAGDAVMSLEPAIERIGDGSHPIVTNSWVLNYLSSEGRVAYLAELERIGAERDVSWVYAEAPAHIPELPNSPDPKGEHRTVLSMVRWRGGERLVDHLATVHPHGFWMQWR